MGAFLMVLSELYTIHVNFREDPPLYFSVSCFFAPKALKGSNNLIGPGYEISEISRMILG